MKRNTQKDKKVCKPIYTYIIKSKELYKIGKTTDIEKRIQNMKVGNPFLETPVLYEGDYEKELHTLFQEQRVTGEWFKLSKEDVEEIPNILGMFYMENYKKEKFELVVTEPAIEKIKEKLDLDLNTLSNIDFLENRNKIFKETGYGSRIVYTKYGNYIILVETFLDDEGLPLTYLLESVTTESGVIINF